jgi:hypothetical protein
MQQKRPYQRISSPPYRDLSNERNVRSNKRGEELDLSGSRKDCTSLCSFEKSSSKNPLTRIGI